ncbi:unnamed protein product [Prorocentrum cordatum]|uniref:USP domain-containing protein n=1 Tax=Prorocentrum cordatum TaxID=2364126 RepID=A0ABN9W2K9_9DINO|nr:unnamed protein product [Polarella glacialis]
MIVHLKRFRFDAVPSPGGDGPSLLAYRARKLGHHVDFALRDLRLGPLGVVAARGPDAQAAFDLFAVTYHAGSCGFGHYTSAVRHGLTQRWHLFDDEEVEPLEPARVPSERAYLLFFGRRAT